MFHAQKRNKDAKARGRSGDSSASKMLQNVPVRAPAGLLDMLAEVASQTLHSDPTVKSSPAKKRVAERASLQKAKEHFKEASAKKRSEVDTLTAAKLKSLSLSQQLRLCSRLDGNEMRRTFTYTCLLEPDLCGQTFSSFGSEGRARQMMRTHLLEHLKNHGPNEPIRVSRRRRVVKVQNPKKKVPSKPKIVEPLRSTRLRYSELYDEVHNLPVNNKENKAEAATDWKSPTERNHHKVQSINVLKVSEVSTPSAQQTVQAVAPPAAADSDEETLSCCSTGSRFEELTSSSATNAESNMTNGIRADYEADSEKSIYTEHSYTSRGADIHTNGTSNVSSVTNDSPNSVYITSDLLPDSAETVIVTSDNGKRIPSVGREIDINTYSATKTIKSEDLPVLCDNRREAIDSTGRENGELRWETTAVERDEFHQHKKPKGKAKFIGQSKAEKEMAIRLINAIKTKASPAGLQSLDTLECRICRPPRCFTAPTTLMSHYRSHAGIKPYECRICRAAFTRQHSLNYHMLIHSNQTRFTCHDCGRKFRHPSHFKEHRRRHTGEAPFECSDCLLRFKTRNTYKRHLKTRHGKVLTTSGGLIILSEEEFKRVRTMPRSSNLSQTVKSNGVGKTEQESEEEEEEEDGYSSSGTEGALDANSDTVEPPVKVEMIEGITECMETCEEETVSDPLPVEETNCEVLNFNDIVREAMADSDIIFTNGEVERDMKIEECGTSVSLEWNGHEDGTPSALLQVGPNDNVQKIQVIPLSSVTLQNADNSNQTPTAVNCNENEKTGNSESIGTILSGQSSAASIPQSLALLQSRYLVGHQPALSVIGSDSQQATVLLLANQHLMPRQPQSDTISVMLA